MTVRERMNALPKMKMQATATTNSHISQILRLVVADRYRRRLGSWKKVFRMFHKREAHCTLRS